MRPKSMILLAVAGLCGLLAAFAATKVMEAKDDGPEETPMETIYVAKADIDVGGLMSDEVVKPEEWPQDKVPDGAVRSLDELVDRRTTSRLFQGEPILTGKLIEKDKWQDASQAIPKGYRVVAVGVDPTSAAANLIKPGHRVDVMVYLKPGRDMPDLIEPKSVTFLKDVKVFSVDDQTSYNPDEEEGGSAKNVSLLVTPKQAQKVSLATSLGKIKLSLRNEDDGADEIAGEITLKDLLAGTGTQNTSSEPQPEADDTGGINRFMDDMQASTDSGSDDFTKWEMTILDGGGLQRTYKWADVNKLPILVGGVGTGGSHEAPSSSDVVLPPTASSQPPLDAPPSDFGGTNEDWLNSNPLENL
ncbi:MAG: Flp pilus assembly protein CpaB [Planctomycetales bacterium]|nr:Flp pilus assembly protein CpaB [Planctomycetales bacterium]